MNTIYVNSKNSKTSEPPRLLLNITDKTDLKEKINLLVYQILEWRNIKIHGEIYMEKYKKVI